MLVSVTTELTYVDAHTGQPINQPAHEVNMMSKFTGEFVIQIKFKHKDGGRRNFVSRGLFNELAHCDYICDAIFYESSQVAGEDAERYGKAIRDAGDSADLIVCKVELKPTSTCYVARPKNTPHNPENDV